MKKLLPVLIVFFSAMNCFSQVPSVQWQKCYGGGNWDFAQSIIQTSEGGYIQCGYAASTNGDVSGNHGSDDVWVVKTDSSGQIEWQRCYGGSDIDYGICIQQTLDGGYIMGGTTYSDDNDVTGNHNPYTTVDAWIVKTNNVGDIEWQKCLGGTANDQAHSILVNNDGSYFITGMSASTNGDVSGNHGNLDAWVVKLNTSGSILWQKCYGGSASDRGYMLIPTNDGNYCLLGEASSNNGDVSQNNGSSDIWLIKINPSGDILWQKCYGGTGSESSGISILETDDWGFIFVGSTTSNDGNVTGNHGSYDAWIVKTNPTGDIEWQKCYGGTGIDVFYSITKYQSGYVATGQTDSNDGDATGNNGGRDAWIVQTDILGTINWQLQFGGTGTDRGNNVIETITNNILVLGSTNSNNGTISGNHGSYDYLLIKFEAPCSSFFNLYPDVEPLHYIAENHATGTAPLTYSWDWGDGNFDNIAYPSHTYDVPGNYTICLTITDANNCSDTYCSDYTFKTESPIAYINVIDPLTVGIAHTEKEKDDLVIYPNPATNNLIVETVNAFGIYQLEDITGKVLLSGLASGETKFSLDISTLSKGIYLLSLIDGEQQVNRKVVKE